MDDLTIRPAVPDDTASLASLYRRAYRENRWLGFPAKAESARERSVAGWIREHRVYVAEVDGVVVGGVRIEETAPERAKLSRLGVDVGWKGKGIGGRLLTHAEAAASEDGIEVIWLTTPEDHPYLPAFYRRRGYTERESYPLDYREYDEVVMEKRLTSEKE